MSFKAYISYLCVSIVGISLVRMKITATFVSMENYRPVIKIYSLIYLHKENYCMMSLFEIFVI